MNQDRTFIWVSHWKQLGLACNLGGERSLGITRVGQTVLARLMDTHIEQRWKAQKRNIGLFQHFSLGEAAPPILALMTDNLVPPCMSLEHFKLLTQCWRLEQENPGKFCVGPLRGTPWTPEATVPTGFYSQKLWGLFFLLGIGTLDYRAWWGVELLTSQVGSLKPRYLS